MSKVRRWSRVLHRDLSYLFSGMIVIYALSGIYMNHRDTINPNYSIQVEELTVDSKLGDEPSQEQIVELLRMIDGSAEYTKHYSPESGVVKVFIRGGSNLIIDTSTGKAIYEKLSRRPLIGAMAKLHYNPGSWWTIFADIFAISLVVITITGVIMVHGNKGLWGRGGVELLLGILIPILFFIL